MTTINETTDLNAPMGIDHPKIGKVEKMTLDALRLVPERFQVRNLKSNNYVNRIMQEQEAQDAVHELREIVLAGGLLDPILVWEDRGEMLVVDGHHRMEAYTESDLSPSTPVWVQRLNVTTESEARKIAYDRNSRVNLNMSPAERHNEVWLAILCGEARGSLRDVAKDYTIGKSSVGRMREKAESVVERLMAEAASSKQEFNSVYVRQHAPTWREADSWRESDPSEKIDVDEMERKKIESLVKSMVTRFSDDIRVHPELLCKAFAQFYEQATGWSLAIREIHDGETVEILDEDSDF